MCRRGQYFSAGYGVFFWLAHAFPVGLGMGKAPHRHQEPAVSHVQDAKRDLNGPRNNSSADGDSYFVLDGWLIRGDFLDGFHDADLSNILQLSFAGSKGTGAK
ncbi:hypothetical protein FQN50_005834 [Emmonsiellopsis sp. PD_5]|nr:hypothetical protein FQN50_005834 [Emmonsiellopsis sp. PD_5]